MTRKSDQPNIQKKAVLFFDICSSSKILEDLVKTDNLKVWRDLLIQIKLFLSDNADQFHFTIYKFLGDGWVLLFEENIFGGKLIDFLKLLSNTYSDLYERKIKTLLEVKPKIVGLTFGIDMGPLIRIVMNEKEEFIGRPINIASRLQGAIKDNDTSPQYKALISGHFYSKIKKDFPPEIKVEHAERVLKNISDGQKFSCYKVSLFPKEAKSNPNSKAGRLLKKLDE